MEEEKKDWVEKFSKEELIEDIQREFATDARNGMGCGSFILILLVYFIFDSYGIGDWSSHEWYAPGILLLLFVLDIWWKKKMSKCEDAHQLVDMYAKYDKTYRIFGYIGAIVLLLYMCYDIYSDFGEVSLTGTLIRSVIAVIFIGVLVWTLFRKRGKKPVEKEIDRLRQLNAQE